MIKSLVSIYCTEKHHAWHGQNKQVDCMIEYNNLIETRPVISLYNRYYSLHERLQQIYNAIKTDIGFKPENLNMKDNSFKDLSSLLLCIATIDENTRKIVRDNNNIFTNTIDVEFAYDHIIKLYKEEVLVVLQGDIIFMGDYNEFMNFILNFEG